MKKTITFSACLLVVIFFFSAFQQKSAKGFLPVNLVFIERQTPDSIQEFIKAYLQINKVETIDWKQGIERWSNAVKAKMMELIDSKKFTEETAKNINTLTGPVYNSLSIEIFADSSVLDYYKIDSISWVVRVMVVTDVTPRRNLFIPAATGSMNSYVPLKLFIDKVLASGYLR